MDTQQEVQIDLLVRERTRLEQEVAQHKRRIEYLENDRISLSENLAYQTGKADGLELALAMHTGRLTVVDHGPVPEEHEEPLRASEGHTEGDPATVRAEMRETMHDQGSVDIHEAEYQEALEQEDGEREISFLGHLAHTNRAIYNALEQHHLAMEIGGDCPVCSLDRSDFVDALGDTYRSALVDHHHTFGLKRGKVCPTCNLVFGEERE